MELRHLRYFIAAAEEEHFGHASERLFVTRPAVSQIIADLERELGTPLFERLAHRVRLTPAGKALLPTLHGVMKDLEGAFSSAKLVGKGERGTLNIGYGSLTLLHTLFKGAIKSFHETYPGVTLSLVEIKTGDQPRALAEGKIHAGFMHFGPSRSLLRKRRRAGEAGQDDIVLDWIPIQTGSLGLAVPKQHRLARKRSASIADLADERLVVVPSSSVSPGYGPVHALCQKAGFEPRIEQEVQSIATQLNLISVGMGIGLVVMGRNFTYPSELIVIPVADASYPTEFVFGWVKGQREPTLDRMIDIVRALASQQDA